MKHFGAMGKNTLLDVACGSGYSTSLFIKAGIRSYDGVDINEEQIAYANYRYASHAYSVERVNYHIGDLSTFNNGKTFDIITCYGVIERINDYESAIKKLYSLLNYGGVLLISSSNRLVTSPRCSSIDDKPMNEFHTQEFTPNELLSLLNCSGFHVSQEKVFGQHQRRLYSNKFSNKIIQSVCAKLKRRRNSIVTAVRDKVPEHFIVVATKI